MDIAKLAAARPYKDSILKLAEEMGELIQAVVKSDAEPNKETRQHVIEEMVDVMICMVVVKWELQIEEAEITDMRHHKMVRNLMRLES